MSRTDTIPLPHALAEARHCLATDRPLTARQVSLLARHFRDNHDMDGYCAVFAKADPALHRHFRDNSTEASFARTTGKVRGAVNVFRRVHYKSYSGTVPAFEKIYARGAADLKRVQWVYRNLWGKPPYQMPRLIETVPGKRYTIAVFALEAFSPVSAEDLFSIVNEMQAFSRRHPITAFDQVHPALLRMPSLYMSRRKNLMHNLALSGLSEAHLSQVEKQIMSADHVFNHGDLHRYNIGQNGMIYDWDSSCFAPAAHDPGRALAALRNYRFLKGLQNAIETRCADTILRDREDMARVMFFYLVYAAKTRLQQDDTAPLANCRKIFDAIREVFPGL